MLNIKSRTLTIQGRLNRYEIAQETIGFMMAMRSGAIECEKEKEQPDWNKIAQWDAEFDKFADELHGLRLSDDASVQRVLDEYCPLVKANGERMRSEQALACL